METALTSLLSSAVALEKSYTSFKELVPAQARLPPQRVNPLSITGDSPDLILKSRLGGDLPVPIPKRLRILVGSDMPAA
jgi:hypothetical protein